MIASIGPTTSETLDEFDIKVDMEPEHSKMGQLVLAAAEKAPALVAAKRAGSANPGGGASAGHQIGNSTLAPAPAIVIDPALAGPWDDGPFMRACRLLRVERTPIWLMRQAGRYMAEYRAVREKTTFLELCKNPALCAEVMLTAVDRLGVDAAIIFSDLLPILEPMGLDLEFTAGDGPVIHNPLREARDVDRFRELESIEPLDFVLETVRQTRAGLPSAIPVIGFAGAPFTLASYAIEGAGSRNYPHVKSLMYRDPAAWDAIMERLARAIALYLNAQIAAGAQAVQLFDSWVGCLGPDDYRRYVLPHSKAIDRRHPARRAGHPLRHRQPGASAVGSRSRRQRDRRRLADRARRRLAPDRPRPGDPRQSRSGSPVGRPRKKSAAAPKTSCPSRRPPRPHLQPRPRRLAAHAGGECVSAR